MKLGVYVGSFNPVHIGHKYIIDYLLNNKYVDKIIVIPTGNYWDKQTEVLTSGSYCSEEDREEVGSVSRKPACGNKGIG